MLAAFDHADQVAEGITTYWFRVNQNFTYQPGQFIELTLSHQNMDVRGQKRWFTLSSSPTEKLVSVTTKHFTSNGSSFKQALQDLKPGSEVTMSDPMGDFVLPIDSNMPLLFIAGGTGITPVRSIVKWLIDMKQQRDIQILYSARKTEDVAFYDLFEAYKAKIDIVLPKPEGLDNLEHFLSANIILPFVRPSKLIYISGPEQMVESLENKLIAKGVRKEQLVLDYFHGYNTN